MIGSLSKKRILKKDIKTLEVDGIAIAAVPELNVESNGNEWSIYIINLKDQPIENVLVSSKGYGMMKGEKIETSQLRHSIGDLRAQEAKIIEPIMPDLFGLSNQYWVSFFIGNDVYDKKYVFLAESITESNLTNVPVIDKKGVLLS